MNKKNFAVSMGVLMLLAGFQSMADDEVCVANTTSTPLTAGSGLLQKEQQISEDAFCVSVNMFRDRLGSDGDLDLYVKGPGAFVGLYVVDPPVGELMFFNADSTEYGGKSLGGGLYLSAAEKGDDGVYRLLIKPQ